MGNKVSAASFDDLHKDLPDEPAPAEGKERDDIGSLETLHNKAHDIFSVPFSGMKVVINSGLSQNFHTSHSISLCGGDQGGYQFGVNYVGHKKVSETEAYPMLQGVLQPNGEIVAQMLHQFSPGVKLQYMSQMKNTQIKVQQLSADIKHNNWQSTVTFVNPDLIKRRFMSCFGTMRQLTRSFALGSQFVYQMDPKIPGGHVGQWNFGGRYSGEKWTGAISLRPYQRTFHSSFHMKFDEALQFAAELESNFQHQTNVATLGYQFDLPKGAATVKAQIDSELNIVGSIEKKIFPFTFSLCAMRAHPEQYAVGVGLSLML